MSTPTPRLLKDLAERAEKENGTKTGNGNGNGKPATNGTPKPLVVEKTPKGPRLTRAAAKVAATPAAKKVPLKLTKKPATKNGKPSKVSKAKELYAKMVKDKKDRAAILAAFIKQVGLTKAGANTYYQLIKSKS